jgi:hypothetical protein
MLGVFVCKCWGCLFVKVRGVFVNVGGVLSKRGVCFVNVGSVFCKCGECVL